MQHSYGNTFTSNIANSNTKYGFKLDGVSHNMFTGNTANSNTVSGFYLVKGESTSGCLYNTFTNNTANSNTEYGLREDNGAHNTLTGNTFNANVVAGLRLKEVITYLTLNNNSISGSPIGIDIATSATTVTTWIVKYNNIAGTVYGVSNAGTGTLDARYNYWGTAAGPYHATTNPGVTGKRGATVTNSVTYAPWLFLTTTANGGNTVANIVANEVPAYAQSVVLSSGWNTFSVPIALDGQYNAWGELYTLTSLPYTVAYRFNPTTQQFDSLATDSTFALAPGEAVYVKLTADNSIPYCYSTPFSIPSRALSAGWNLIGGGLTVKTEVDTCISIATSGSTAGYTHIISPAENAQAWIYIAGAATAKNIALGEGYWVFLPIARTLGLFDLTPVTWVP
jgi:parallel beta-helix repeat protein